MVTSPKLTREEVQELLTDEVKYLEHWVRIPNKDREMVPFTLWPCQRRLAENLTGRDVTLKDSQCGFYVGLHRLETCQHHLHSLTPRLSSWPMMSFTTRRFDAAYPCHVRLDTEASETRPRP